VFSLLIPSHVPEKPHLSIDRVCGLLSRALQKEVDTSLRMSEFMLSDEYYLKEVDFGEVTTKNGFETVFCMSSVG
jgi:hypothetical protein